MCIKTHCIPVFVSTVCRSFYFPGSWQGLSKLLATGKDGQIRGAMVSLSEKTRLKLVKLCASGVVPQVPAC